MVDRISLLSQDVVDSILTCLDIKEAARTCILSQSWRYRWCYISKIKIDREEFYGLSWVEFVRIVDHILLFHNGSVNKFELVVDDIDTYTDVDRWIEYVSANGIKELVVDNRDLEQDKYNIPSCIFSCDLTCFELTNCTVKPPAAFEGFGHLTKLAFTDVTIDTKILENVINLCPLLSELILEHVVEYPSPLKIDAPNLGMLRIQGFDYFPRLIVSTPLLESAYFSLEFCGASANEDCNYMVQLLGSMATIRRLELDGKALQHMAVGDVPACLPFECQIRHMAVTIDFGKLQDLLGAFCIFRSSPFLQHLAISSSNESRITSHGFWKGEGDFGFEFSRLQTVEMDDLTGSESEVWFIKFLLSKAVVLKSLKIHYCYSAEDKPRLSRVLARFPRVSPIAELILPAY